MILKQSRYPIQENMSKSYFIYNSMDKTLSELSTLFFRDLNRLEREVEKLDDNHLWEVPDGVINSCGVLVQHINGNLNHFMGSALGETGYKRDRDREFTNTGLSGRELIEGIGQTRDMIEETMAKMDHARLDKPYPLEIPMDYSVRQFLFHLYGHLNYHLGQVNYLRRILDGKEG